MSCRLDGCHGVKAASAAFVSLSSLGYYVLTPEGLRTGRRSSGDGRSADAGLRGIPIAGFVIGPVAQLVRAHP